MIIRHGTMDDMAECLVMAENFYQVAGYKSVIPFCAETTAKYFKMALDGFGCMSVAEKEGKLVGFIVGLVSPSLVNENYLVGTELAWWMEPEHRKGSAGIRLLRHIEKSAKEIGCILWSMMCLEEQAPEKIEKMYLSEGYKKTERTFTKILQEKT